MKKPNKNFKKLSSALRKGYEIAKENGIRVARGRLFRYKKDGSISCACAFGMAAIGLYGPDPVKLKKVSESKIVSHFDAKRPNECLAKKLKTEGRYGNNISDSVFCANDKRNLNPDQIADKLEECHL